MMVDTTARHTVPNSAGAAPSPTAGFPIVCPGCLALLLRLSAVKSAVFGGLWVGCRVATDQRNPVPPVIHVRASPVDSSRAAAPGLQGAQEKGGKEERRRARLERN